jgi:putative PIN family toxin of toxin-antitoxin system
MRVVFDTNVWISGLVFKGEVRKVIQKALDEEVRPVISIPLLRELEKVLLSSKIDYSPIAAAETLHQIQELCLLVHPTQKIRVIHSDPVDNRVLECALEGQANLIVSGDKHLPDLGVFRGIRIITPKQFLIETA